MSDAVSSIQQLASCVHTWQCFARRDVLAIRSEWERAEKRERERERDVWFKGGLAALPAPLVLFFPSATQAGPSLNPAACQGVTRSLSDAIAGLPHGKLHCCSS